jgi:putative transcriptional regulator
MAHVDDQLPELLLGTLEARTREDVERHLEACAACRKQWDALRPATEALVQELPSEPPPPALGRRLMEFIRGEGRFADFAGEVARLFDVEVDTARELLRQVRDPNAWMDGPAPGVALLPVASGPRLEGAMAAFVRLSPGASFPTHTHGGQELNFVLQGGFREDTGREVWPGQQLEKRSGTTHAYVALEGPDCIAASILWGEIRFAEES